MANSKITIDGIGEVTVFRRRGLKNLRISLGQNGEVRLSIPWYVSQRTGIKYLLSKKDWIITNRPSVITEWQNGQRLTDEYKLTLLYSAQTRISSKLTANELTVNLPKSYNSVQKQKAVSRVVKKFLRTESERLLIPLTREAAKSYGFEVKSVQIKQLKSRWGSCNHKKEITLNAMLLTLPDELIEYVIIHELAHTRHLNHSKDFWQEVEAVLPRYKTYRKNLKKFNSVWFV